MNPFTESFDLRASVGKVLGNQLAELGVEITEANDANVVELRNRYCRILLSNRENRFVGFQFHDLSVPDGEPYHLRFYLDVIDIADGIPAEPEIPREALTLETFEAWLHYYKQLLTSCFNAPLSGDFSWAQAYRRRKEQLTKLEKFLSDRAWVGDKAAKAIVKRQGQRDLKWEEDALSLYKDVFGKNLE